MSTENYMSSPSDAAFENYAMCPGVLVSAAANFADHRQQQQQQKYNVLSEHRNKPIYYLWAAIRTHKFWHF